MSISSSQPFIPHATVAYVAAPATPPAEAQTLAAQQGWGEAVLLRRRGTALAWVAERRRPVMPDADGLRQAWQTAQPMLLPGFAPAEVEVQSARIRQSLALVEAVLAGTEIADCFEQSPYAERLAPGFEMLAAFEDEGDPQEIETLEFDAVQGGEVIAENLWVKASWLSFEDDDASLRFRFSFGLVGYEDVAADPVRQHYAAALTEALFPESAVISANPRLAALLQTALGVAGLNYVERIVYFNAPNGGAQFHQDVERGHLGVVFAQAHGGTGWLTLPKQILMDEIQQFAAGPANAAALAELLPQTKLRKELLNIVAERASLAQVLDAGDHDALEALLNRCPAFIRQLVEHGHCYLLRPGDLILLPQHDAEHCAWHTVFCLDEFMGEALSFAVRAA
ncbi:MAG: hypothetical protein AABZ84_06345 [Pseudomonadota bacterium]